MKNSSRILIASVPLLMLIIVVFLTDPCNVTDKNKFIIGQNQEVICRNILHKHSGETTILEISIDLFSEQNNWDWNVSKKNTLLQNDTAFVSKGIVYYKGENAMHYLVESKKK